MGAICGECKKERTDKKRKGLLCLTCRDRKRRKLNPEKYRRKYERVRLRRISDPEKKAKLLARNALYAAVRSGKLLRQPSEVCGTTKVEAHHDDYSKRLDVKWLCQQHHQELHRLRATNGQ